jgi:hypothetical protein
MDAGMRKHRMTLWMGRLLFVLSVLASWGAQAALDSVAPLPPIYWRATSWLSKDTLFKYTTLDEACNSYQWAVPPGYIEITLVRYNESGNLQEFSCFQSAIAASQVISWADCPVPTFYTYIPYGLNWETGMCERIVWYSNTITLSGGTEVEPSKGSDIKTLPIIATVKQSNGQPPANPVKVHISLKVDPTSGGHVHGDNTRPRGGIAGVKTCASDSECWSGTTDGNGQVVFNFNPTDASGTHTISATCDGCTNTATKPVDVKVPNLITIQSTPLLYSLIGGVEGKHTDNHYLTSDAEDIIWGIAADYHMDRTFWQPSKANKKKLVPPSPLGFNDASLIWGGKFDLSGKWSGNHYEHHKGVVIDIRANGETGAVPDSLFSSFEDLVAKQGATTAIECTSNKVDGQGRTPPSCIGKDGSSDQNRHYHVKILGKV